VARTSTSTRRRGFHLISPDYPGFGHTTVPDGFAFTFDRISEVIEAWLAEIGFTRFGMYHQDYARSERQPDRRPQRRLA
jgi:pimeloyl-ACP methyl ester carboxylesterase